MYVHPIPRVATSATYNTYARFRPSTMLVFDDKARSSAMDNNISIQRTQNSEVQKESQGSPRPRWGGGGKASEIILGGKAKEKEKIESGCFFIFFNLAGYFLLFSRA